MNRKLIIDGTAVYEVDEECMLKKRLNEEEKNQYENGQTMKAGAQDDYIEAAALIKLVRLSLSAPAQVHNRNRAQHAQDANHVPKMEILVEDDHADHSRDDCLNGGDDRDFAAFGNILKAGKVEYISESRRDKSKADAYSKQLQVQRILDTRPRANEDGEKDCCK